MLQLRDRCQTVLQGWSTLCTKSGTTSYISIRKVIRLQLFRRFENLLCSRSGIAKFIKVFERTGSVCRQPGVGTPSKVTSELKDLVEQQMVRRA